MINPIISVILATKNEQANIARCIESIKQQSYPYFEIINIDNASIDGTRSITTELLGSEFVFNLPEYMDISDIKNYRGAQVNFGASRASGDILFFPDADMTFESELFSDAVKRIAQFDALCIPEIIIGSGYIGAVRNFERSFYNLTCIDAPRFVLKSLYLKVGGFDERLIAFGPDDWDLAKKLKSAGAATGITERRKFHHEAELNLAGYLNKKMNYVNTFSAYITKWGKNDPDVCRQFGFGYRFWTVFTEHGKWIHLLARPDLALGMYFLRISVGFAFLLKKLGILGKMWG